MLDTILGLPAHPLLVHGTVVLLPLTALLVAWVSWKPRAWARAGLPLTLLALLMTGLAFATKQAGELLADRLGAEGDELVRAHEELGELVPILTVPLALCAIAMWVLARRRRTDDGDPHTGARPARMAFAATPLERVVALFSTLIAATVIVWTIRAGHTGAEAVWMDTVIDTVT